MPEEGVLHILRHDLHKLRDPTALRHKDALRDPIAVRADGCAAWMSRNMLQEPFSRHLLRKSLVHPQLTFANQRTLREVRRLETVALFKQTDPLQLHNAVLASKLLNLYCEARHYPFTSLKYHILLATALYHNFQAGYAFRELALCENAPVQSPFQVIYRDPVKEWAILPSHSTHALSKIAPYFSTIWERRTQLSIGGEFQELADLLATIGSWTIALATLEDYAAFLKQ